MNNTSQVLSAIFTQNGIVFGGFVRDMLAGEKPKDIDVETIDPMKMVIHLTTLGKVEVTGSSGYGGHGIQVSLTCFSDGEEFLLDINKDKIKHRPDVDVNRLIMDANSIHLSYDGMNHFYMHEVLEHIQNRSFYTEYGCSQRRIKHMLDKGWTHLNFPNPPIEVNPIQQVLLPTEDPVLINLICDVYSECGKIPAIKTVRALTNCDLKAGKNAVEYWAEERSLPQGHGSCADLRQFFARHTAYQDVLDTYHSGIASWLTH